MKFQLKLYGLKVGACSGVLAWGGLRNYARYFHGREVFRIKARYIVCNVKAPLYLSREKTFSQSVRQASMVLNWKLRRNGVLRVPKLDSRVAMTSAVVAEWKSACENIFLNKNIRSFALWLRLKMAAACVDGKNSQNVIFERLFSVYIPAHKVFRSL